MGIGRSFPFPVNLAQAEARREIGTEQQATNHFEAWFPLIWQYRKILRILIHTCREIHWDLKNQGQTQKDFRTGQLVIFQKQVKSNPAAGILKNWYLRPRERTEWWGKWGLISNV